jgi:hypothetical protein
VARRAWNNRFSNPEAYHMALKEYDRALRRKQRSSWRDFCSVGHETTRIEILSGPLQCTG